MHMERKSNSYAHSYIYKLILKDQSTYIGLRHCNCLPEEDPYLGSGSGYKKEDVIKKEILIEGQFDDKTLALLETAAIMDDKCQNDKNVNIRLGAYAYNQFCLSRLDEKTHQLMSEKAKQRWRNPEQYKFLKSCREKQMTEERRKRISETVKKTTHTEDWGKQHSNAIRKVLTEKRKDPNWCKRMQEIQEAKAEKLKGRVKVFRKGTLERYAMKKEIYSQNKDLFQNWNSFQSFIKGFHTKEEILAIIQERRIKCSL